MALLLRLLHETIIRRGNKQSSMIGRIQDNQTCYKFTYVIAKLQSVWLRKLLYSSSETTLVTRRLRIRNNRHRTGNNNWKMRPALFSPIKSVTCSSPWWSTGPDRIGIQENSATGAIDKSNSKRNTLVWIPSLRVQKMCIDSNLSVFYEHTQIRIPYTLSWKLVNSNKIAELE